jgi:hypothetical protein
LERDRLRRVALHLARTKGPSMKLDAAILVAVLIATGMVLAQSSDPSAAGLGQGGQAAMSMTAQASEGSKTSDSGKAVGQGERPAKPDAGAASNTVGVSGGSKGDRHGEHYP